MYKEKLAEQKCKELLAESELMELTHKAKALQTALYIVSCLNNTEQTIKQLKNIKSEITRAIEITRAELTTYAINIVALELLVKQGD